MQVPICRHIKTDGLQCHGVALHGYSYCYFHKRLHASHQPYRDKIYIDPQESLLNLPATEDRASVQLAISSVINALATGCITERRATALFYGLQLASSNARGLRIVRRPTQQVREVCKDQWVAIPEASPDVALPGRTVEIDDPADCTEPPSPRSCHPEQREGPPYFDTRATTIH